MRHRNLMSFRPTAPAPVLALALAALMATALPAARAAGPTLAAAKAAPQANGLLPGDYIVQVVNTDVVTAVELEQRIARLRAELPPNAPVTTDAELRKAALEQLTEERVLATYAREAGVKVDDGEVDQAVRNIAASNKMTLDQLRERLRSDGLDYGRFKDNLRDQIASERIREREVVGRIKVTDSEIADYQERQRAERQGAAEVNLAQILVTVPERATPAQRAERQARAEGALARVRNGEPFEQVAREVSDDANRLKGGEMGSRPLARYPDLFADAVRELRVGAVTPQPLVSGAGFHILKVLSRADDSGNTVTQTRVRHILLRPSAQLSPEAAERRLRDFSEQISSGKRKFEDLAREFSEDGSAPLGGDLGWAGPGMFVPEFEQAMSKLDINGLSAPVVSRFGVHLIQVLERKQVPQDPRALREQAKNVLKEQKFEGAYTDWVTDLRAKAFIEAREAPLR